MGIPVLQVSDWSGVTLSYKYALIFVTRNLELLVYNATLSRRSLSRGTPTAHFDLESLFEPDIDHGPEQPKRSGQQPDVV